MRWKYTFMQCAYVQGDIINGRPTLLFVETKFMYVQKKRGCLSTGLGTIICRDWGQMAIFNNRKTLHNDRHIHVAYPGTIVSWSIKNVRIRQIDTLALHEGILGHVRWVTYYVP